MKNENEVLEFKSQFTPEIYKSVVAFANTDGGEIIIGKNNNGENVGIEDIDGTYNKITNGIRDSISPDVTMFADYKLTDGCIHITVNEGTEKPYYLKSKGLKPGGVYVRQGASNGPASENKIKQMIKESDGDCFEDARSLNQELTFDYAKEYFRKKEVEFTKEKFKVLGLTKNDLYTNLALILSDQCPHTVKVGVFEDRENTVFRNAKEFGGSIFRQLEDTFEFLDMCNSNIYTFDGLDRIEHRDYPVFALREALINSLIHREYSYRGSILIYINREETVFISEGGIMPGIDVGDIISGVSEPRNPKLAQIFHRLHLIEAYGTGIRKIYNRYRDFTLQPEIKPTNNTFKFIMPNMNINTLKLTEQETKLLDYIKTNQNVSERDICSLLGVKSSRVYVIARALEEKGLIYTEGRGKTKIYKSSDQKLVM